MKSETYTNMKNNNQPSRRQFLAAGSLASLGLLWASNSSFNFAKPNSVFGGVQIGILLLILNIFIFFINTKQLTLKIHAMDLSYFIWFISLTPSFIIFLNRKETCDILESNNSAIIAHHDSSKNSIEGFSKNKNLRINPWKSKFPT